LTKQIPSTSHTFLSIRLLLSVLWITCGAVNLAQAGLPAGWSDADIGLIRIPGAASRTNGVWTLVGSGLGITNTTDRCHFAYTELVGDGAIVARVTSQDSTNPGAHAGVMMRAVGNRGAPEASVVVTVSNGIAFRFRANQYGSTVSAALHGISPDISQMKLVLAGQPLRRGAEALF
jgi:hypothetical protein